MARLGDYVNIRTGKLDANAACDNGMYPFFTCSKDPLTIDTYSYDCECVLVAGNGDLNVKYYAGKFDAYQRTYIIQSKGNNILSTRYLYYFLDKYAETLRKQSIGGVIKYIKLENLSEAEVPLPPLDEQRKIAAVLDKVSDLIAKRRQQLDKLDTLVKARFVEMFGAIQEMVPLSYYIRGLSAGKSLAGEDECVNKVLKTGATTYDSFDSAQVKNLPLDYIPQEEHRVKTGDVIISRMNTAELVGAAAYVWEAPDHTYLPDRLWKAEVRDTACPIFVWQLLIQKDTKESIRRIASGTSGSMKNISKPGLLGIRVIKAEVATQNRFAAFVAEVDKSILVVNQSLEKLETLKKSLMQQYFE